MGCNPTKELHEDIKPALHSPAFVEHSPASSRVTTQDAVTPTRNMRKSPCRRWLIGKRIGRRIRNAACNQSCCRWFSGRCWLPAHNQIKGVPVGGNPEYIHLLHFSLRFCLANWVKKRLNCPRLNWIQATDQES